MKTNVLLLGPIGTGKNYCLRTALECGKEVMVLALESGTEHSLGDIPCEDGLHWHYIEPMKTSWETLQDSARKLNELPMDAIAKLSAHDKRDYDQFLQIYSTCSEFTCDRCGEAFGAVDSWDDSRLFAVDGLTSMSRMASQFVTGSKPIRTLPETGAAQDLVRNLIHKLTEDTRCSVVLLSHIERETNPLTGGTVLTVSTIGQKLAPDIPKMFDHVILTRREGSKFFWSTDDDKVDLKTRGLDFSDTLPPTFKNIFKDEPTPKGKKK